MKRKAVWCFAVSWANLAAVAALPFSLKDSDPESPEFKKNYLGSYGINAAIEPKLEPDDRPLYEEVLPFLTADPDQAIRVLEEEITPESNAAFNFLLGSLFYMEDRLADSESQLLYAIEKHPSFRRAHRTLALVYARTDKGDKTIEHLLRVITLGGGDAQSYGMLGYSYLKNEKYRSALEAYQNARMFAPDSFDYKRGEAQCLLNANQYAEAIALYDELIAENPDESEFWLLQANAYLALDLREETAANLEMARTLGDVTFQNLSLLASLYIQGGATDLGAEVAVSSLDFADSRDASALIRQIEHLSRSGNADQANVIASAFSLKLAPQLELDEGRRFASVRAMIDFRLGLEESGSQRLVSILEEDPLNGEALILLARHYSDKDEFEEAEFYFERALSVEDYQREALVALGQMEVRRGNFKEALDHLREAQELKFESNVQNFLDQVEEAWRSTRRS